MAQENLDLNININTKGSEVIGLFRKELKEANGELLKAQTLYGDYSAEAVKAAQAPHVPQVPVSQVNLMSADAVLTWAKTGLNNSAFNAILSEKCIDMLHESVNERPESPIPPPPSHTPADEKQKKPLEVEDLYG